MESKSLDWQPVLEAIENTQRVVLTTHVRPDTDGIGSAIALHRVLTQRGKSARILIEESLPSHLRILDPDGAVETVRREDADWVRQATVVVLDVGDRTRLGLLGQMLEGFEGMSICLDHHASGGRAFARLNMVDPAAPATGVLVWDVVRAMGATIDPVCAQALYATIVADTGSFRFSNTTSGVLRVAADLVDLGASPAKIARAVLAAYSSTKMTLLSHTLASARHAHERRLTWSVLSRDLLQSLSASVGEVDGLIEYLRLEQAVQAALLFVELDGARVKVSFRSEVGLDVLVLAEHWGGGGHRNAAGAVIEGSLDQVVSDVVATAGTLITQGRI